MATQNESTDNPLHLFISWLVVGIPLVCGVWTTILQLPSLFKEVGFGDLRETHVGAIS